MSHTHKDNKYRKHKLSPKNKRERDRINKERMQKHLKRLQDFNNL